eukprot:1188833-Prorocentrum_minimum.AAC.1
MKYRAVVTVRGGGLQPRSVETSEDSTSRRIDFIDDRGNICIAAYHVTCHFVTAFVTATAMRHDDTIMCR